MSTDEMPQEKFTIGTYKLWITPVKPMDNIEVEIGDIEFAGNYYFGIFEINVEVPYIPLYIKRTERIEPIEKITLLNIKNNILFTYTGSFPMASTVILHANTKASIYTNTHPSDINLEQM